VPWDFVIYRGATNLQINMKILCVHAHFDDFEFVASGLFELSRRRLGQNLRASVIVCTDGRAGHHFRPRAETGPLRLQEQLASARIGQYEFEQLLLPNGQPPREACLQITTDLLAALWKTIRAFQPDYLFCPPVPNDPLAGIHVDHVAVAEAIRKVAYMINVPHAFTPEYPADETKSTTHKTPVIINVHDAYMCGENAYDLAVDVEDAFDVMLEESWQHQSQITEWLPWVGRHDMAPPKNIDEWRQILRHRFQKRNREMGLETDHIHEFFTITAWGQIPTLDQLQSDFPNISSHSRLDHLARKLTRWRAE
jgi:LmbE family N-acetylglucosaminyl deacetylase